MIQVDSSRKQTRHVLMRRGLFQQHPATASAGVTPALNSESQHVLKTQAVTLYYHFAPAGRRKQYLEGGVGRL